MSSISDHPLRYTLANELHARPFPVIKAPAQAGFLALVRGDQGRDGDHAHLVDLLDRYGALPPKSGATHWYGQIGKHHLKWESHTEFSTYTIVIEGEGAVPAFSPDIMGIFPEDWLARAPGTRITSALIEIGAREDIPAGLSAWFVPESLSASQVLDEELIIAADFRIDPAGHMRVAVFPKSGTGARRIGRVVQRLCEIETYKAMSLLALPLAREYSTQMDALEGELTALVRGMSDEALPEQTLARLLDLSARLERVGAQTSFRFAATRAYGEIVGQRVEILRESRYRGYQTFGEFMTRRFDPAMRTVTSFQTRLEAMAKRASRAAELLRTRVDVERSKQSQDVLKSMDQRAELQLRLQKTVEGLSVVAVSYYAVNLGLFMLAPTGIPKMWLGAGLTPIVVLGVFMMVKRIKSRLG